MGQIKSNPCKECGSIYHTKMYHKPRKPIASSTVRKKRTVAKPAKKKAPSRSKVVKDLDDIFSKFIRLRDDGKGCVTCGVVKPWKEMQACHYYTRGRLPTRWHEDNVFSGCYRCNVLLKGNYTEYAIFMVNRFGIEYVEELKALSLSNVKIPTHELRELTEVYKKKVAELL